MTSRKTAGRPAEIPSSRSRPTPWPSRTASRRQRPAPRLPPRRTELRTGRVRLILITLLALMIATAVGLGATWMTATRGTDLGTLDIGAWAGPARTGTSEIIPIRARRLRAAASCRSEPATVLCFRRRRRPQAAARRALRRRRQRRHAGSAVLDADALRPEGPPGREFAATLWLHQPGNRPRGRRRVRIRLASRSRAGNWLPTGGIERYALMLRLYDTPVGVATRTQRDAPMPSIATGVPVIRLLFTIIAGVLLVASFT